VEEEGGLGRRRRDLPRARRLTGRGGPLDAFTSPEGALRLAIAALLAVVGYRLARPERGGDWLAVLAYAGALGAVLLAERAAPAGAEPGVAPRAAGAALLVLGLVVAGSAARAARRAAPPPARGARPPPPPPLAPRARPRVHAGLALVLCGHLLRAPTAAGGAAVAVALAVLAATAWLAARRA
jgi:hypothetical protein